MNSCVCLAVLHVCKLPPEEHKMVPCVKSAALWAPLQRPEINFAGIYSPKERHTMGVC